MSTDSFAGSTTRHGTNSGWTKHKKLGERACDACTRAKQEYDKRRKAIPEQTRLNRLNASAQGRAEARLRRMYPEDYAALYAEEKARLVEEGE